jgi:[lysine-biosynthesis-protein LysW]---L-2-aminoadipate ligase
VTSRADAAPIAVLASVLRADEKRLLAAMDRHGLRYELADSRAQWGVAGGKASWWRGVFNREIGQLRALYAARTLEALGIPVLNSAHAIGVCGDKWQTSLALAAADVPAPRTALGLTPEAALEALEDIGYPAVLKPLVGSHGRLIATLRDRAMAADVLEYVKALPGPQSHLVYVQELIAKPARDIRVLVVGGELAGAAYRVSADLRTNVARGARTQPCPETTQLRGLAIAAAAAVRADIAAVDIVEDADGELLVIEVNHRVEFSGLQLALGDGVDVAGRIVDYLAARAARW